MRAVSAVHARRETRVPVHVSRIHRVRVMQALESCAHRAITAPICLSDIAAACSTVAGVRVVHAVCSSSGAGAGARRQAVPTVLGSTAAAVEMAHSGLP